VEHQSAPPVVLERTGARFGGFRIVALRDAEHAAGSSELLERRDPRLGRWELVEMRVAQVNVIEGWRRRAPSASSSASPRTWRRERAYREGPNRALRD